MIYKSINIWYLSVEAISTVNEEEDDEETDSEEDEDDEEESEEESDSENNQSDSDKEVEDSCTYTKRIKREEKMVSFIKICHI